MLDSRPSLATVTQTTVVPTDTRVEREVLRIFHVEDELKPDLADLFDEEGVLNGSLPWFAVGFGIDILAVSDDLGALLRELQAKGHKLVIDHKTE